MAVVMAVIGVPLCPPMLTAPVIPVHVAVLLDVAQRLLRKSKQVVRWFLILFHQIQLFSDLISRHRRPKMVPFRFVEQSPDAFKFLRADLILRGAKIRDGGVDGRKIEFNTPVGTAPFLYFQRGGHGNQLVKINRPRPQSVILDGGQDLLDPVSLRLNADDVSNMIRQIRYLLKHFSKGFQHDIAENPQVHQKETAQEHKGILPHLAGLLHRLQLQPLQFKLL